MEFQHVATSLSRVRDSTRMTLFGRAVDGRSVAVHIDRVPYYGYVQASCAELGDLRTFVSTWCRYQKASKYGLQPRNEETREDAFRRLRVADFTLDECSGFNIRNVREGPELPFTRFKTTAPSVWRALNKMLTACKEATDEMEGWAIDEGFRLDMPEALPARMLYETHFTPDALYMVDHRLTSCGWMRAYGPRADPPGLTTCDVEIQARDVEPFAAPQDLAPLRVLSYDIEAQPHVYDDGREPGFPQPQEDPILTIGVVWFDLLDTTMRQAVFQLEPADVPPLRALAALEAPPDAFDPSTSEVFSYTDERQLLLGFASYVRKADPDIVTGYNIVGFDNAYLIQRAEALGIRADKWRSTTRVHLYLGRMREQPTALRKIFRSSKQKGGRESYETSLEGRCWNDIISAIRTDHKLRSYKLDDVAEEFLGTKKIHIAYDRIPDMQKTKEGRHTLASYCVKDAWLPCQLGVRLSKFINGLSMAQVTGVSLDAVWHRGQQVRTITLMLSYTRRRSQRWFLPDERNIKQPEHSFEGAVVITPMPGFYKQPVVTLDFASLYPSIMRAYNTCFSTLIATPAQARARGFHFSDADPDPTFRPVRAFETAPVTAESKQNPFRYVESPDDTCFVTRKVRRGILPEILETLLTKRKQVKKRMKSLEDGTVAYSVADGYQLALKVCANSVYGFTGASTGFLPEKRIASAVTKAGRGMTNEAKYKVEFHYRDHGVKIVYGDSVIGSTPLLLRVNGEIVVRRIESLADVWGNYHGGKESAELAHVETWTEAGWTRVQRVIRHRLTKPLVQVQTHSGYVVCTTDHSLLDADGNEVAPRDVAPGDTLMHRALPDCDAFGWNRAAREQSHARARSSMHAVEDAVEACRVSVVMQTLGIPHRVEKTEDGFCIVEGPCAHPGRVRSIRPYTKHEEYVYDLTTDNHHFQAGVGSMIVHNTDSIFVHLPESLCPLGTPKQVEERATALGEAMSELCNTCFLPPNDLEYEKFYWPILLKGKKRYAGWKVEPGKKTKLDVKGFECVRRDFAPIVSETQKKVFELLIKERDTPAAVAFATKRVQDLMYGRCELRELTLSKQLTQPPENYASSAAHVALAKRLIATLPATVAPKVGDRIDFLIRTGREKLFERAITPEEAAEGKYEVDLQYYLEKQLRKPLFRVFDMVVPNPEDIFRVTGFKRTIPKSSPFAQFVTGRPALRDAPARDDANPQEANPRKKKKKIGDIRSFF